MKQLNHFESAFFKNNPIAILVIDPLTSQIVDANGAAIKFYGYDYEVLISMTIHQINLSSPEVIKNEIYLATQEKRNFFVFKHQMATGIVKTVEVISTPIVVEDRTLLFSMITDTTTSESFTERLIQSNHRLTDIINMKNEELTKELSINRALLENLDDAVILYNELGQLLVANNSFHVMFDNFVNTYSVSLEELIRKIEMNCYGSNCSHVINALFSSQNIKDENLEIAVNGEKRFFVISTSLLFSDSNDLFGRLLVIKEITSSVKIEQLKSKAENKYREIFNNTPTGIVSFNLDGVIDECNDEFVKMLGSDRRRLIGFNLSSIPNTKFKIAIDRCVEGYREDYEGWYTSVTGSNTIYMNAVFSPVTLDGKVIGGLGVISDVTSIKDSEKIMESQMVRFEALFMNSPIAVVQFDSDHKVLKINNSFTSLFGYTSDDVIGRELDALLANNEVLSEMKGYTRSIFDGRSVKSQSIRSSKYGEKIDVELIGIPITIDGVVIGGYSLYSDIREQLKIKEQLIIEKNNAEFANTAKAQFLANMSHEIRTPMNGFMGILELLTSTPLNAQQKEYLRIANTSAQSLRKLVSDILDYSKIESNQFTLDEVPFNIYQLTDEVINLYKPSAIQKGLELYIDFGNVKLGNWSGDAYRIKQVLSNLVNNAIKFTKSGEIKITLDEEPINDNKEYKLIFKVRDTGVGIPSDKLSHIFERFGQAHEHASIYQGGTGLGLSISKWIAEKMNGDLYVDSSSIHGTTFIFSCVLKPSNIVMNEESEDETRETFNDRELSILMADDDETSSYIMNQLAIANKWRLVYVSDGQAAVSACYSEKFDVILMDCQMPIMNGFDASILIRKSDNLNVDTPIIALTAFSQKEDVNLCFESGMNYYFSKPIDYKGLVKKVNALFEVNTLNS